MKSYNQYQNAVLEVATSTQARHRALKEIRSMLVDMSPHCITDRDCAATMDRIDFALKRFIEVQHKGSLDIIDIYKLQEEQKAAGF